MGATAVTAAVPVVRHALPPHAVPALALAALAAVSGPLQGLYAMPSWGRSSPSACSSPVGA
jgi:hypothetical protein